MTLEAAVQENTAAIRDLISRLTLGPDLPSLTERAPAAAAAKPAQPKPVAKTPVVAKTTAPAAPKTPPAGTQTAPQPDYEASKKQLLEVARLKGRDAALAVLEKVSPGAKSLLDVAKTPETYQAVIDACKAALTAPPAVA